MPLAAQGGLPSLDELLVQAESLRPRTMGEKFQDAASEFAAGLAEIPAGVADSIAIGAQAIDRMGDGPEAAPIEGSKLGRSLREIARWAYPPSEKTERGFTDALAGALGSGTGFVAGGAAGQLARLPVMATTALLGAGTGAATQFYDAKANGASDEDALAAWALGAGVGSSEAALGVGKLLSRVDQASGGGIRRAVLHTAFTGIEEAGQEAAAQAASNLIAKHLVAYDEDRALAEGLMEQFELGGAAGLILGGLFGAASMRARGPQEAPGGPQEAPGAEQATKAPAPASMQEMAAQGAVPTLHGLTPAEELGAAPQTPQEAQGEGQAPEALGVVQGGGAPQAAPGERRRRLEELGTGVPPLLEGPEADAWIAKVREQAKAGKPPEGVEERRGERLRVEDMTDEEMKVALLTSELTGLPNKRAWEDFEKAPVQVSVDADSLAWINDNLGHDLGDVALKATGGALGRQTGQAFHRSGDEFGVGAKVPAEAEQVVGAANEELAKVPIWGVDLEGRPVLVPRLSITWGVGSTFKQADKRMAREKIRRQKLGLRAERKTPPPGTLWGEVGESLEAFQARVEAARAEGLDLQQTFPAPPKVEQEAKKPKAAPKAAEPPSPPPIAHTPAEPALPAPEPETTSVKNRVVDRELREMGLDPAEHGESTTFRAEHAKAKEKLDSDPFAGKKLVDELEGAERATTPEEGALLALELNRLINERDAAEEAYIAKPTEANFERVGRAKQDYARAADVATKAGTASGQSLAFRKMMIARDYSLAAMERRLQVANGGKELSAEQSAEVKRLHDKLKEAEAAHELYVLEAEARTTSLEAENAALRSRRRRRVQQRAAEITKTKKRIETLFEQLARHSSGQANIGLDPRSVKLVSQLAYEHIKLGVQSFAQFADVMVARLGEGIRPALQDGWDDAQARTAAEGAEPGKRKKTREESALQAFKTRTKKETERIKERSFYAGLGVVVEKDGKKKLVLDKEALRLKADIEEARAEYLRLVEKHRLESRTKAEKALDAAKEVLALPRALKSSWDFSAVLRQGAFFTLGHPIETVRTHLPRMFRAAFSERAFREIDIELRERPLAEFARKSGLDLTTIDETLTKGEEAIRSQLSDKIPGMRASNRAFVAFLNSQRAAAFDAMVQAIPETPTAKEGKAIAALVNVATGRGDVGKAAGAMSTLANILWSPRLMISRFQLLVGQPLYRGTLRTKVLGAKEYARFLVGLSAVYAMASLLDADIEDDPRSSDFGKIRFGTTRLDPLAGLSQTSVLTARLFRGETKTIKGDVNPIRGEVPYGRDTSADVIARFLRTKLTPLLGTAIDLASGENVVGEPVTPESALASSTLPLTFSDLKDALESRGVPAGSALAMLSIFGWGLQDFPTVPKGEMPAKPKKPVEARR